MLPQQATRMTTATTQHKKVEKTGWEKPRSGSSDGRPTTPRKNLMLKVSVINGPERKLWKRKPKKKIRTPTAERLDIGEKGGVHNEQGKALPP